MRAALIRGNADSKLVCFGVLTCLLLLLVCASAGVTAGNLAPDSRPNIVVIMTDDLDERSLQFSIEQGLLPLLRQLFFDNGVRFSESFVTTSLCCPSRASWFTGQYIHNHGVLGNGYDSNLPGGFADFDDSSTVATWLSGAGYFNGYVGKYLNGYNGTAPAKAANAAYVPPGWHYWRALQDPSTYRVFGYNVVNGDTGGIDRFVFPYQTDQLAVYATEFLNRAEKQDEAPFFLQVNVLAPHEETVASSLPSCQTYVSDLTIIRPAGRHLGAAAGLSIPKPPSYDEADISDKPDWLQAAAPLPMPVEMHNCLKTIDRFRLESLLAVEDLIRAVVRRLAALNELNTVIVFTSDNGFMTGEHRLARKSFIYEESIRVPLLFRDLQSSTPATIGGLALNIDMAPTIADLAGVPAPGADGRSLLPLIANPSTNSWRRQFLIEHYEFWRGILPTSRGIRSQQWKYVQYVDGNGDYSDCAPGLCEYYDLVSDPYELNASVPLIPDALVLGSLAAALAGCAGDQCRMLENAAAQAR